MIIIHPEDHTTRMLTELYHGTDFQHMGAQASSVEIRHRLYHTLPQERIMLLGHGCPSGLYSRQNENSTSFDRLIISHHHAYALRRHGSNLIGIWCHAHQFARRERLHGLFSGMIITELSEAEEHGVPTTQDELNLENTRLFTCLRALLDAELPLRDIPGAIADMNPTHTPLTNFNYNNFFYL